MADHVHSTPVRRPEAVPAASGRRSLFAGAAAVLALGSVPLATAAVLEPDAALIAASAEFKRLQHLWDRVGDSDPNFGTPEFFAVEAERNRIGELQDDALDAIMAHPPTTMAGFAAIASALVAWDLELLKPGGGTTGDCLIVHLVESVLAAGGRA